jgi:hypothetical protein
MRTTAIYALEEALPTYLTDTGLLSDELQSSDVGESAGAILVTTFPAGGSIDARILPELGYGAGLGPTDNDYSNLQDARAQINQALGALAVYDTSAGGSLLRSELYSLEGYTEILLADFFCSGVPLSTLDFAHDYTYHVSATTSQLYDDALTKLDSARILADTDAQMQNLARVLQGRAWLALGQYDSARSAVSTVPDRFQYQLAIRWQVGFLSGDNNLLNSSATTSDREGRTGLPYISSHDPRVAVTNTLLTRNGVQLTFPARYHISGFSAFVVADGIEARLIQAEAAYQSHDPGKMVSILNALRSTATVPGQSVAVPDTLTDPGTDSARVAILFQERAYWLFLTGHRQGDLRRLLRQYGQWYRSQQQVYPTGAYTAPGTSVYGADVTAPIPGGEYLNPFFNGCLSRDA